MWVESKLLYPNLDLDLRFEARFGSRFALVCSHFGAQLTAYRVSHHPRILSGLFRAMICLQKAWDLLKCSWGHGMDAKVICHFWSEFESGRYAGGDLYMDFRNIRK